jgi:FdhD protein
VSGKAKVLKPTKPDPQTVAAEVWKWRPKRQLQGAADRVATEEPLEIRVRGRGVAVTMRTPGHDAELAAGFLLAEGLVRQRTDVLEIAPCRRGAAPENTLNVFLAPSVAVDFDQLTRHVFASSSCGLCGKASIDAVHRHFPPLESRFTLDAARLLGFPRRLRAAQVGFDQTGGLHAAGIFDARGRLMVLREDVGRHNAVDKVIGYGFLAEQLPFDRQVLMVSGRASFEILQKALAARIPIVCAVSAPSSLALEFARESGQTLIGFLRGADFNIYSHPERILFRGKGMKAWRGCARPSPTAR